ncbi:hypothetical protein HZA40_01555 [Candidatus Peregrinibacteria bacterium]|nr:hypothetical protein [Candidatus Peregrinibacteria bacterium]
MEKKILHTFRALNSLFHEARFVYKKGKGGSAEKAEKVKKEKEREEAEKKEAEDKRKKEEETVKKGAEGEEEKLKGRVERDKFRKEEKLPEPEKKEKVKLPMNPPLGIEEFKKRDSTKQNNEIDRWRINVTRENYKINAQTWDHSTIEGLQKIYQDCRDLGIINQDRQYYDSVFAILRSAADPSNSYLAENGGAYRPMFKEPTDGTSRDTIASLAPKGKFPGGEAYIKAYDSYVFLKAQVLIAQDKVQIETLNKQRKMDEDPIGTTVVDFAKRNIATIQKAAQSRDYATLAVYTVGGYALWKTLGSKLFGDGHEGGDHKGGGIDFKKWLLIGAAVYGADKMLKNAGYDVLKMTGLKSGNAEVKGTPLESMQNVLAQPQYNDEFKDLDYGVAMRMSETKLTTLQDLMMKANKDGIHFVHPNQFPSLFPDMKNVWPFKMGQGEQGLKDYVGMSNTKLSASEREYIRMGQQIYKLAFAMGIIYDNTLHKEHEKYKGMTYEQALKDPTLSQSKVRHLMEAAGQYAPEGVGGGLFSAKKMEDVEDKLRTGTDKVLGVNGFTLESELQSGSGHFAGHLKGFPVVVVVAKDGYRVYLRNRYGDKYNPVPGNADATIPLSGNGMKRGAEEAVKKVDRRMEELVKGLKDTNKNIDEVKYMNGQWQCVTKFKGAPDLDVAPSNVTTSVNVDELGKTLRLDDGESTSDKYLERTLVGRIAEQQEFKALRVFANAGKLKIEDKVAGDGKITLVVGNNKARIELEYFKDMTTSLVGKFRVVGGTSAEKALVQNQSFAQDYIDALDGDKEFELNKNIANLKKQIEKAAPEGFVKHFFTSLFQQNNKSAVSGFNLDTLSGSIPENFINMVLGTSKIEVLQRLRRAILTSDSLTKVETERKDILQDFNDKLVGITQMLTEENIKKDREGKKWDRDEFMGRVIDRVRKASCTSSTYALAKSDFEYMAYSLPVPGFLTKKSDLGEASHNAVGELMGVFVYYTAHLDNPMFNGSRIDLDHLQYPPEPTKGKAPADDPKLRGHLIVRYFEYVKNQIYSKGKTMENLSVIPPATAQNIWQIKEFEKWAVEEGDYRTLDPMDEKPPYTHNEAHPGEKHTELDMAMAKEYQDVVDLLTMEYPGLFNENAINDYLHRKIVDQDGSPVPPDKMGILYKYRDSTGKAVCKLWDGTNRINRNSNGKRSNQTRQMQAKIDQFVSFIFTAKDPVTGNYRFFAKKPSLTARLIRMWPWLNNIL